MSYTYSVKKKGYPKKFFKDIGKANDYANKIGAETVDITSKNIGTRISKEELRKALERIGQHNRFPRPGRFLLCKEVYGDDRGEEASATEWECSDYFDEGIDELYKALKEE